MRRSIWVSEDVWQEIKAVAKQKDLSVAKYLIQLHRIGAGGISTHTVTTTLQPIDAVAKKAKDSRQIRTTGMPRSKLMEMKRKGLI